MHPSRVQLACLYPKHIILQLFPSYSAFCNCVSQFDIQCSLCSVTISTYDHDLGQPKVLGGTTFDRCIPYAP